MIPIRSYPKQLLVGDDIYDIKFVRKISGEGDADLGLCVPGDNIQIRLRQGRQETLETFVHEILHSIEFTYEIPIPHQLVYQLEKPIAKIILDNFIR